MDELEEIEWELVTKCSICAGCRKLFLSTAWFWCRQCGGSGLANTSHEWPYLYGLVSEKYAPPYKRKKLSSRYLDTCEI